MLIPTSAISHWKDLQNKVAMLFREMGYVAQTPFSVQFAGRGSKEVDVHIVDPRTSVPHVLIAECKHWSTPVPQDTVHSMLAIMQGCGANTGLIISSAGFQSGAGEAAAHSNIRLLTWEDLQQTYGHEWFLRQKERIAPLQDRLRLIDGTYLDQWETPKTITNLMPFQRMKRLPELYDILEEGRMIQFAVMGGPKSYDQAGPIEIHVDEGYPGAVSDRRGMPVIRLADVRAYFEWVGSKAQSVIARYEALSSKTSADFENLGDEEIDRAFAHSLDAITEEMPVRVLKQHVGEEEYARLLRLLVANLIVTK